MLGHRASNFKGGLEKTFSSPAKVAAVGFLLGGLYLVSRILGAGHGSAASLIVAGSQYVKPNKLGVDIPIIKGSGYDGQFYFRLALDPFSFARTHSGITFDNPFRAQRIIFPLLSWLIALGDPHLVPISMLVVELLSWSSIVYFAAQLARTADRSPALGVVVAAFPGYFFSVGRDLTEPTATALLLAGTFYLEKAHYWRAASFLSLSVLTKETGMVVVFSLFVLWVMSLIDWSGSKKRVRMPVYSWLIPLLCFGAWQLFLRLVERNEPLRSDISGNLSLPAIAMIRGIWDRMLNPVPLGNTLWIVQFGSLTLLAIVALSKLRSKSVPPLFKVTFITMLALAISLSKEIWLNDNYLRSVDLIWVFGWLILIFSGSPIRKRYWVLLTATAMTAAQLVFFI